jgi:hypothetical protein
MSDLGNTRARTLRALIAEFEHYRRDHGPQIDAEPITRALTTIQGRRSRVAALHSKITEIRKEVRWLEDEIEGREAAVEAMLREALGRWERLVLDAWLPTAVLGYRMWSIEPDGLRGARVLWPGRRLTAHCDGRDLDARLPHSDGRCGRLGCGIYATKRLGPLLDRHVPRSGTRYVAGVVALTGKVVEHESGYRGQYGEVVAAAAVLGRQYLATHDRAVIDGLCRAPADTIAAHGRTLPSPLRAAMESFLTEYVERRSAWISDASNG